MQLMQKKNVDSYKDNYGLKNWNFVKLINKVLQKWRNYENCLLQTTPSRTLLKKRSARETRKDCDHEDGIPGDHGSRLLQYALRPPGKRTEALERALSAADPAKHRHPLHTVKIAQRKKRKGRRDKHSRPLEHTRCPPVCWSPLAHRRRHHEAGSQHNTCGIPKNGVHCVRLSIFCSSQVNPSRKNGGLMFVRKE